ncbi:MAG: hypothetical protein AAFQ43_02870 [Bacteroidota bacterium]
MTLLRSIVRSVVFVALVGAVLLGAKQLDTHADISPVVRKERALVAAEPEIVFVGSSRTYRHVVTPLFDSLRAASGVPTTSYNFGVPGSSGLEIHYRVGWLLEYAPASVRQIVVEIRPILPVVHPALRRARRTAYFHDVERTRLAARVALATDTLSESPRAAAWDRVRIGAENHLNIGWGPSLLSSVAQRNAESRPDADQGYAPLDTLSARATRRRQETVLAPEARQAFLDRLESFSNRQTEPTGGDRVAAESWAGLAERAEQKGIGLVFLESPGETEAAGLSAALASGGETVLVLNDPERFPEWYRPDAWFDSAHFAEPTARKMTAVLAEELPLPQ